MCGRLTEGTNSEGNYNYINLHTWLMLCERHQHGELTTSQQFNPVPPNPFSRIEEHFPQFCSPKGVLLFETRKSSCVNARGIPTVAYQVLHLLSCNGGGGSPARGYPIPAGGYPISGTPQSDLSGVPPFWTWLGYSPWT